MFVLSKKELIIGVAETEKALKEMLVELEPKLGEITVTKVAMYQ